MPYLVGIYINAKLLCIYIYKTMGVVEKHSNMVLSYSVSKRYDQFFKIKKITPMEYNQYKFVYNNLEKILK